MKKLLLYLLLCSGVSAYAQTSIPVLLNVGVDTPFANITAISPQGSMITWSYYEYCTNVVCFNDGLMLHTVDSNGNKMMTMRFEKPLSDFATSSKITLLDAEFDNEGNFYMAGRIHSNVIMSPNDPGTPVMLNGNTYMSNSYDMFVAKYKVADGKLVWAKHMPVIGSGMSSIGFMHMAVDGSNNVYLHVSNNTGTFDIDPGTGTVSATDDFIVKYSKDGAYLTHKSSDAISTQIRKALHWKNNGLYLVTNVDSAGKKTILVRQYDPATLNISKSKKIGWFDENNSDNGFKKKIDVVFNQGNIWLMGTHVSSLNLPAASGAVTQSLASDERGYFLAKLDANWNLATARVLGIVKNFPVGPVKLGIDGQNNLLVIGAFRDSMDFDLGAGKMMLEPMSHTYFTIGYMAYYDQNLDLQWAKTFGDTSSIYMYNASFGNNKRIYVAGSLKGNGNFALTGTPNYKTHMGTNYTAFLARYMWPTASTNAVNEVNSGNMAAVYPNPCTDQLLLDIDGAQGAVQLSIYDLSGKLLTSKSAMAGKRIDVNTASLVPGMYYLKVQYGAHMEAHSFLKR